MQKSTMTPEQDYAWRAINHPAPPLPSDERLYFARRKAEMEVCELISTAKLMGGFSLGNLSARIRQDHFVLELKWWQLDGMRPVQVVMARQFFDQHEFSHAVRAVAFSLLVRALGVWASHLDQWRGGRHRIDLWGGVQ